MVQRAPRGAAAPALSTPGTVLPALIVDDEVHDPEPGQMRRSEFLAELRAAVCETTAAALAGTPWSEQGCPWVEYWFGYYSGKESAHVETVLRRYAPESSRATTARGYIPFVADRVRRAVEVWAATGRVTGVPEEIAIGLPGVEAPSQTGPGPSAADGPVLPKGHAGGAQPTDEVGRIRSRLGAGRALESGARGRMESVFGADFSGVRIHTDPASASLSAGLNARAFTIGSDIAFGSGEYQPNTMVGDALLAHELAHVVQQGGTTVSAPLQKGAASYGALESDADTSAVSAVAALWGGVTGGLGKLAANAMPGLKSGLRLQRCGSKPPEPPRSDNYETLLKEASENIGHIGFGGAQKVPRYKYWTEYWDVYTDDRRFGTQPGVGDLTIDADAKLVLKPGKKLSKALDTLMAEALQAKDTGEWKPLWPTLDCAQYVQVVQLVAIQEKLGTTAFDTRADNIVKQQNIPFTIGPYDSTTFLSMLGASKALRRDKVDQDFTEFSGSKDTGTWKAVGEIPGSRDDVDGILKAAPIGSRVTWTNTEAALDSDFRFENTIKVSATGYSAHGFKDKKIFTRAELELELAKMTYQPTASSAGSAPSLPPEDYIKKNVFVYDIEQYELPEK